MTNRKQLLNQKYKQFLSFLNMANIFIHSPLMPWDNNFYYRARALFSNEELHMNLLYLF